MGSSLPVLLSVGDMAAPPCVFRWLSNWGHFKKLETRGTTNSHEFFEEFVRSRAQRLDGTTNVLRSSRLADPIGWACRPDEQMGGGKGQ